MHDPYLIVTFLLQIHFPQEIVGGLEAGSKA
ncbi:hypothetical protein Murru_2781 [Allomuricauda ruestringensis DSM 13258]|uniref:Uncharacterized protein n=1 Tax=Allomuricauda ruestringensis (strain DSM 13258 / CIP 107369 / LMG 19739 / B1) TaxID=886377 RepID=G2PIR0_ALLRU|nr:hypothetical protein Murru_2781 [Allomuricauda ruestringensis DSM 13258]